MRWPKARPLAICSTLLDPCWGEGPSSRQDHRNAYPVNLRDKELRSPACNTHQTRLRMSVRNGRSFCLHYCLHFRSRWDFRLREVAGTGYKGEVRPTPAFRLLRVGAELCVNEYQKPIYQENTVFLRYHAFYYLAYARIWIALCFQYVALTNAKPGEDIHTPSTLSQEFTLNSQR